MKTYALNRAALTVIPKQPYIDWANTIDETGPKYNADDPHQEHTVYLVPVGKPGILDGASVVNEQ